MAKFKSVQSVEIDALVGLAQVDTVQYPPVTQPDANATSPGVGEGVISSAGQMQLNIDQLMVTDTMDVTVLDVNATNPDVEGTVISPAGQTPLWNLMDSEPYSIHAEGVWQMTNSTPDVVVAVIDTGMAFLARDSFLNLLDGYDFISDDWLSVDGDERDADATDPGDWGDACPTPSWHGTKVASILAARHDNALGMKGVAQNCSVLPVRVLGMCRMGYATDVADAIVWAAGGEITGVPSNPNPAKIISLSLAGQGACPDYLQSAVTLAVGLGAVVVAAAGNSNKDVSGYFPANCKRVMSVAASTRDGNLAGYSNWGKMIKMSAPGGDSLNAIMALSVNALETDLSIVHGMGTSFAAPHVSGLTALIQGVLFINNISVSLNLALRQITANTTQICLNGGCARGVITSDLFYSDQGIVFAQVLCSNDFATCSDDVNYWCDECTCSNGYYREYRSDGYWASEKCTQCGTCIAGQYRKGCVTTGAGYCHGCQLGEYCAGGSSQPVVCSGYCNAGQYMSPCTATAPGTCTVCTNSFRNIPATTTIYTATAPMKWTASSAWSVNRGICYGCDPFTPTNCRYWQMYGNQPSYICAYNEGYYVWWSGTQWLGSYRLSEYGGTPWHYGPGLTYSDTTDGTGPVIIALLPSATSVEMCIAWTVCPAGMYQTGAPTTLVDRVCTACTAGSFCLGGANAPSLWTAACSAGYQETTSPTPSVNRVCAACTTAGDYCDGTTTKVVCPVGFVCTTTSSKAACPAGSYCLGGANAAVGWTASCSAGTQETTSPTASVNRVCSACTTSGEYCDGTTLKVTCPAGSFCSTTSSKTTCTSTNFCPSGSTTEKKCDAGYYCPDTLTKTQCPQGGYCPTGVTTPTLCSKGTRGLAAGATSIANCEQCAASTFSGTEGSSTCSGACALPQFSLAGASQCTPCTSMTCTATYKVDCKPTADDECRSCSVYPGSSGAPPANAAFTSLTDPACTWVCDSGYYLSGTATKTCVACTSSSSACSSGQYRQKCADGGAVDGGCTACTNAPVNSVYTGKSTTGWLDATASSCPFTCNAGYTSTATDKCCLTCANGKYISACTKASSGSCVGCNN